MRAVVQRGRRAKVVIDGVTTAEIDAGLLLFVGVANEDGPADVEYIVAPAAARQPPRILNQPLRSRELPFR